MPRGRVRRWLLLASAAALTCLLPSVVAPVGVAQAAPSAPAAATASQAAVQGVQWIDPHRVQLDVYSPAMHTVVPVQILLARDWYAHPTQRFPSLTLLDGMRADPYQNGWTMHTDAESFFADKDVNVVLPIGGDSSYYTNWIRPDNGHDYQWETFLTGELPPILHADWRTTDVAAIAGLSMGGGAAMTLAARHPGMYRAVASYSGDLHTSTPQNQEFLRTSLLSAGFDTNDMWGPFSDPAWRQHDPFVLAPKLRGTSIYVSAGNGMAGPFDKPSGVLDVPANVPSGALESLADHSAHDFAARLAALKIPATVHFRSSGTHSWPYWEYELHQSWPQLANALDL